MSTVDLRRRGTRFATYLFAVLTLLAPAFSQAASFSISASPSSFTIYPGSSQTIQVKVTGQNGYAGPVYVSLAGLPSGISVSPSPLVVNAGSSGTITLTAALNADQEAFPATGPGNPNSKTNTVAVIGAVGSNVEKSSVSLTVSLSNPSFAPVQGGINLPMVTIDTSGTPIVDTTTDVPGTITITDSTGTNTLFTDPATFHGHGHSTWAMPKKPYNVKLQDSTDLLPLLGLNCGETKTGGCDKSKSYVLLANYDDKTFLRDWTASALANAIPMGGNFLSSPAGSPSPGSSPAPWAPHSVFVELYLNGQYEGDYQLIEQVKVDSHRVNINEMAETDTTPPAVTGGYLMEIDARESEDYNFKTPKGLAIGMNDPDYSPEVPEQESYITNYVDQAETALYSSDFTNTTTGWPAYFDEASAVNFYIVNDVMGNQDGGDFYSSDYFYKDINNPLLYMGPIWDFDISSGNDNYGTIENPTVAWMQTHALWYQQFFKDPNFKAAVVQQWNAIKQAGVFSNWIASIAPMAATLEQGQQNNFGRWPMQGERIWPNAEAAGSYDAEVQYLTSWLNLRIAYLDSILNGKSQTTTTLTASTGSAYAGKPVTLSGKVAGSQGTPTGSISFLSGALLVGTASVDTTGAASLTTSSLPQGSDSLRAVYMGDNTNALSSSNATTVTISPALITTTTSLAASTASTMQGGSVTFTVEVVNQSGSAAPTGSVSFDTQSTHLGSASLSGSAASLTTTALPVGSDTITATYAGSSAYSGSASNTVSITVAAKGSSVATPEFSPVAGTYSSTQTVTITDSTSGSTIYYTTNGTTPTAASTKYTKAITVSSTETLKAIAVTSGGTSAVATATYTINKSGSTPISFGSGFGTHTGIQANGKTSWVNGTMELTNGGYNEASSAFYATKVSVSSFTTTFTIQQNAGSADGMMFVIEDASAGAKALGPAASALGYSYGASQTPTILKSVGIKFDLYSNSGEGSDSTGLYENGAHPTVPAQDMTSSGVNLHSGHAMVVTLTYNGTTLSMTVKDSVTGKTYSTSWKVNIPSIVGASTAYAGFTAGTGGESAVQQVVNWTYSTD